MTIAAAQGVLACPTCGGALQFVVDALHCARGHAFDVARQGYVNLLGGPQPANADTSAMVESRERVLASGLFAPVAAEVARRTATSAVLAEVGAGTGYYLGAALDAIPGGRGIAFDVSVPAARRAARSHPRAASVVADVWKGLPVLPRRLGAILCVFAPRNLPDFARALGHRGLLVVVTPTPEHLAGVRERYDLLDIEPDKDERLRRQAVGLFDPIMTKRVEYTRAVPAAGVADLIAMGPNAFHGVPGEVADADVTVSVVVHVYRNATAG